MNGEFFEALRMLEKEKGISADLLVEKITNAIVIAVKRDYNAQDNVMVNIDLEKQKRKETSDEKIVKSHTCIGSSLSCNSR